MPLKDTLKINLDPIVSKYLDFLKMELKQTFKELVEDMITEKYKEVIKERL